MRSWESLIFFCSLEDFRRLQRNGADGVRWRYRLDMTAEYLNNIGGLGSVW